MNRRDFVRGLSTAALVVKTSVSPAAVSAGPSPTPVRMGIIGAGSRGKELVRNFLRVPGVSIVAAADVYPRRFEEMNELCGHPVAAHSEYRALLDRKDLDAVIVATPLYLHARHVVAALGSRRHVYGEKTMAFTVSETEEIVKTAGAGKQIYQVGHQYRYAPWMRAAIARVAAGEIGEVTQIQGYWHRNSDWRRPVSDPSLERLINWRLYNEYSLGLLSELGSHHIDIANWVFGEAPQFAYATGSIAAYHDGRENDDNVQAVLSYSTGRRFLFSSMTNNAKMGDQLWMYGSKGSLNLTLEDAVFFYEPEHIEHVATKTTVERGVATGPSYQPSGEMPYRGAGARLEVAPSEDPTLLACRSFIESVRSGEQPIANAQAGARAALAVITANQAISENRTLPIPPSR